MNENPLSETIWTDLAVGVPAVLGALCFLTAMVAVNPGIEPKTMPTVTPRTIASNGANAKTSSMPERFCMVLPFQKGPLGRIRPKPWVKTAQIATARTSAMAALSSGWW